MKETTWAENTRTMQDRQFCQTPVNYQPSIYTINNYWGDWKMLIVSTHIVDNVNPCHLEHQCFGSISTLIDIVDWVSQYYQPWVLTPVYHLSLQQLLAQVELWHIIFGRHRKCVGGNGNHTQKCNKKLSKPWWFPSPQPHYRLNKNHHGNNCSAMIALTSMSAVTILWLSQVPLAVFIKILWDFYHQIFVTRWLSVRSLLASQSRSQLITYLLHSWGIS